MRPKKRREPWKRFARAHPLALRLRQPDLSSRRPTALSRVRILSVFIALIALTSALAACGGGSSDDPQTVVDEATLQGIESGKIDLARRHRRAGRERRQGRRQPLRPVPERKRRGTCRNSTSPSRPRARSVAKTWTAKAASRCSAARPTSLTKEPSTKSTRPPSASSSRLLKQQGGGQDQSSEIAACQEAAGELQIWPISSTT